MSRLRAWVRRRRRTVCELLAEVIVAVSLGGCARDRAVVAPREPLPAAMLTCPPEPDLRRVHDDAGVAHGIVDLAAAGRACRARLDATRDALNSGH